MFETIFESIKKITMGTISFLVAFILSYNAVMEVISPFGPAFVAGVSPGFFPFALLGSVLGYLLTSADIIPLRYIATLITFAVIRGALPKSKKYQNAVYSAGSAAFASILTGFTVTFSRGFSFSDIILYSVEALLVGSAAYFFINALEIRASDKVSEFTAKEIASLSVSGLILLLNFATFEILYINPSLFLCTYLIMIVCTFGDKYSGTFIAGILALVLSIGTGSSYILWSYILSSVLMTIFSSGGAIISSLAYVCGAIVTIPIGTDLATNIIYAIHALVGALIYILTPQSLADRIELFFTRARDSEEKLKTAEAIWNKHLISLGHTIADISDLLEAVLDTTENMYPEEIASSQMRGVVSKQISDTSGLLLGLSRKISTEVFPDMESQARTSKILKNHEIYIDSILCTVDNTDLLTIELLCPNPINQNELMLLADELGEACDRYFDPPTVRKTESGFEIRFTERPRYKISLGAHQITGSNSSRSGDCYTSFSTSDGKFIIILSDGMGTGTAASLGSALSVKILADLLREGIDFPCALSLTNTAVMVNSGDESLATIDIACIDIYTGRADFYKAGAAATLVRHGRRISKLDRIALPIGILRDVEFSHSSATLQKGDIILMSSDGIWIGDEIRIAKQLSYFRGNDMEELAERIAVTAKVSEDPADDITVLAARIDAR